MKRLHDYVATDVMTHRPVTIDPSATLADAERMFERHGFNCLPVHHGERLLGILTKLDLLRAVQPYLEEDVASYDQVMAQTVASVMTRDPLTVGPRMPITEVLQLLLETRHKSLPVVIGALLIGVIAREDVMRAVRRAAEGLAPEPVHYWNAKPARPSPASAPRRTGTT